MSKLVSVIIPVYNVEKYIDECVKSIINQSYKKLDIILIDDGSTDNSGKICDQYKEYDDRIRVIHKSNGGAASAKNAGLKNILGEYIVFVDGDDFIKPNSIKKQVEMLESKNVDIVQTNFIDFRMKNVNDGVVKEELNCNVSNKLRILDRDEYLIEYSKDWKYALIVNKIYKKKVLKDIYFIEGRCIDDEFFTYRVALNCKSIMISDIVTYNYRIRSSSVMHDSGNRKIILKDQVDFIYMRFNEINKLAPYVKNIYLENLVDTYILLSKDPYIDEKIIKMIKNNIISLLDKIILYKFKNIFLKVIILKILITPKYKILNSKNNIKDYINTDDCFE